MLRVPRREARVRIVDTICLDRDVLDETSISGAECVPVVLSLAPFLLPPTTPITNVFDPPVRGEIIAARGRKNLGTMN